MNVSATERKMQTNILTNDTISEKKRQIRQNTE